MSLRRQFVLIFVAFSLAVSALGGTVAYRTASRALERELDQKLYQVAGAVAEASLQAEAEILSLRPGDEKSPTFLRVQQQLQRLKRFMDEAYILRASDLTALVTSLDAEEVPVGTVLREFAPYGAEIQEAVRWGQATSPVYYHEGEKRYYKYGFVRLEQTDAVLAVRGPADYMKALTDFRWAMIRGSLIAAALAALLGWFLATTVSRPLERLGRVALRIQRGRMDEPVQEEGGSELRRLSRAMERMRQGILQRDEQLRLMLAQVAHEIRNPLGGLELLTAAAVEAEDQEERFRLLGKVRGEIASLNRIIDDFLSFSRPRRAEAKLHDIRQPIEEAVGLLEAQMREQGIALTVDLPSQPVMAWADPEHVKRVILNLLKNASQAGDAVILSCRFQHGEVLVSVKDNGPGISAELSPRIFEPFVTDKEKGAGLGLAIVRQLVQANEGRIEVHPGGSTIGEGAEFRIYFPGGEDWAPNAAREWSKAWRRS